jgi:uncharacterized protein (DUF305 family)
VWLAPQTRLDVRASTKQERIIMYKAFPRIAPGLVLLCLGAACKTAATQPPARVGAQPAAQTQGPAAEPVPDAKGIYRIPGIRQPFSIADVNFMSGMIPHHAQAVLIAGWAASHGARQDVGILCERIVVAQRDEIALMQTWLHDRGQEVPSATATHHKMKMPNGMVHDMLMPGMLSPAELAELDKARGPAWDQLFLKAMIKHHQGAITMVDELFASYGAAQDDDIYRFASDVYADQTTEIERMTKMLAGGGF